jgi:hypothetical protein
MGELHKEDDEGSVKPHRVSGTRATPYEGTAPIIVLRTSGNGYFVGQSMYD